jgi:uncharacterized LabA/DUF88 family protein
MKLGVMVDLSNIYYCVRKRYDGAKVDYKKLLAFIAEIGEIHEAHAYGSQMEGKAKAFILALETAGFKCHFKHPKTYTENGILRRKADWDVGITIDMMKLATQVDMMVLVSADGDMSKAVSAIQEKGCKVLVIGCGISGQLRDTCDEAIEIPPSLLEIGGKNVLP